MSREPGLPPERELADDEEWDDEPEAPRRRLGRRALVAAVAGALLVGPTLLATAILTIPAVSDAVLLPKTGPELVLDLGDLPAGFRTDLDQAKAMDLSLDDSQASRQKKAQLVATGFGGGWIRTFESDAPAGLVQVSTGVSVYAGAEGAHLEWQRTIAELDRSGSWKRFALGSEVGDEAVAYEQTMRGAHATLVYYRYANVLAQVSLTYVGAADEAFKGAAKALRDLARAQTEKERLARFRP